MYKSFWCMLIVFLAVVSMWPSSGADSVKGGPEPGSKVPCSDARGCPDLVVDGSKLTDASASVKSFDLDDCVVQEGIVEPGNRTLLRFQTTLPNIGSGTLIAGSPSEMTGPFEWNPCLRLYVLPHLVEYRLWTVDGFVAWNRLRNERPGETSHATLTDHHELRREIVGMNKLEYCVRDFTHAPATRHGASLHPSIERRFQQCASAQGVTPGWATEIPTAVLGQWIDVTGVPEGRYVLEVEVNPRRWVEEESYSNNRDWAPLWLGVTTTPRPSGITI